MRLREVSFRLSIVRTTRALSAFARPANSLIIAPFAGGIAQLGERLHGMQEVSGSIPLTSTKIEAASAVPIV